MTFCSEREDATSKSMRLHIHTDMASGSTKGLVLRGPRISICEPRRDTAADGEELKQEPMMMKT